MGTGKIALASLLANETLLANPKSNKPAELLGNIETHFPGKAKAVIHLFMAGAPSQLELFTEKPTLTKLEGQPLPASILGDQRYAFIQADAGVLGPRFKFGYHGESKQEMSEALPHLATVADDISIFNAVHTDQFNHAPAQLFMNTGFGQPGRPSIGSWVKYALGAETSNLPAYVVMNTGGGVSGGAGLYSSGFLPTVYTGISFRNSGPPILNVETPAGISNGAQQATFDLIKRLNQQQLKVIQDPEISTRIASYEMAARLQLSAPELIDLKQETQENPRSIWLRPDTAFIRPCLFARTSYGSAGRTFYQHLPQRLGTRTQISKENTKSNTGKTDQGSAALVKDLKRLGLLDETLVIWGGEFGRTPMIEQNPTLGRKMGRDHHPQAYTMWMAGGGIKRGYHMGATDEFGFPSDRRHRPRSRYPSHYFSDARFRSPATHLSPRRSRFQADRRAWRCHKTSIGLADANSRS